MEKGKISKVQIATLIIVSIALVLNVISIFIR